jgi:hypothetical protein
LHGLPKRSKFPMPLQEGHEFEKQGSAATG